MFEQINLFAVIVMLVISSYEDIKTREVRLLTQGFLLFQVSLYIIYIFIVNPRTGLWRLLIGLLVLSWAYYMYKRDALGGADAKIISMVSVYSSSFPMVLVYGTMCCIPIIAVLKNKNWINRQYIIPMIPIISILFIIGMIFENGLLT
jgi:Flp pilus assembly protein protease CpaA